MVLSPPPPPNVVQERPDIIIATPGRLWELLSADPQPYLKTLDKLRFFVLDEVDRMVDAGHFKELDNILQLLQQKSNGGSGVEGEEADQAAGEAATAGGVLWIGAVPDGAARGYAGAGSEAGHEVRAGCGLLALLQPQGTSAPAQGFSAQFALLMRGGAIGLTFSYGGGGEAGAVVIKRHAAVVWGAASPPTRRRASIV